MYQRTQDSRRFTEFLLMIKMMVSTGKYSTQLTVGFYRFINEC
jgi:hypothetical protein